MIEKFKNTVSWTYVISDLKGEETAGKFHENELQQINQIEFRFEEVIKRKGDRLHVKGKGTIALCTVRLIKKKSESSIKFV